MTYAAPTLTAFLVKGPIKLPTEGVIKAKGRARAVVGCARELFNLIAQYEKDDDILGICRTAEINLDPLAHIPKNQILTIAARLTNRIKGEATDYIDNFRRWWEEERYSSDTMFRIDPDDDTQQIVFAGSTGDESEPTGFGFRVLQTIEWLGCFQILGLR